jgi:hypothetical protein
MLGWTDVGVQSTDCFDDRPVKNSPQWPARARLPEDGDLGQDNARCNQRCTVDRSNPAENRYVSIASWGYIGGSFGRCQQRQTEKASNSDEDDSFVTCETYMKREMYRGGPITVAVEPDGGFAIWSSGLLGDTADHQIDWKVGPHHGDKAKHGLEGVLHPGSFQNTKLAPVSHPPHPDTHPDEETMKRKYSEVPKGVEMCNDNIHNLCYHYEKVDHSVTLFGWGETDQPEKDGKRHPYWLLKNSWGSGWGMHDSPGMIKVIRGQDYLSVESIPIAAEPVLIHYDMDDDPTKERNEPGQPLGKNAANPGPNPKDGVSKPLNDLPESVFHADPGVETTKTASFQEIAAAREPEREVRNPLARGKSYLSRHPVMT